MFDGLYLSSSLFSIPFSAWLSVWPFSWRSFWPFWARSLQEGWPPCVRPWRCRCWRVLPLQPRPRFQLRSPHPLPRTTPPPPARGIWLQHKMYIFQGPNAIPVHIWWFGGGDKAIQVFRLATNLEQVCRELRELCRPHHRSSHLCHLRRHPHCHS